MVSENNIDYRKLIHAMNYYQKEGFTYLDLDWIVKPEISEITKPKDRCDFYIRENVLVASAEQIFLQMMINGELKNGRFCGITPCFRDEKQDRIHPQYFMKVELIETFNHNRSSLEEIIGICQKFYENYLRTEIIKIGENAFDIIDSKNKIELGSYGIRTCQNINWIYATGCAEPRLTKAIQISK